MRPVCPACGFVQYLNPAPGAGVVLFRDRKICLVRRKFEPKRQELMKAELARIMAQSPLSPDVYEVVSKSLA